MAYLTARLRGSITDLVGPKESTDDLSNPITSLYDIQEIVTTAGAGLVWKVHNAVQKKDSKQCSVFLFDKRQAQDIFMKDKKEALKRLRNAVKLLETNAFPKTLEVWCSLQEGPNTLAFATEPVMATLHHILVWHSVTGLLCTQEPEIEMPVMAFPPDIFPGANPYAVPIYDKDCPTELPEHAKEYYFLDLECRFGFLHILEALHYIHNMQMVHRNVCPQSVVITSNGVWKLFGLEFCAAEDEECSKKNNKWNKKLNDASQPMLNYRAPEVQFSDINFNSTTDIYSFGLLIYAVYNYGNPIIDAHDNIELYIEEVTKVEAKVRTVMLRMPETLQEAVKRMLNRDPASRPTTALLFVNKYFSTSAASGCRRVIKFLIDYQSKSIEQKLDFLKETTEADVYETPKKLRIPLIFNTLKEDLNNPLLLGGCIRIVIFVIKMESDENYTDIIHPILNDVYNKDHMVARNCAHSFVPYIKGFPIMMAKCNKKSIIIRDDLIPVLMEALESSSLPILNAALSSLKTCLFWIENQVLHEQCLPRLGDMTHKQTLQDPGVTSGILSIFQSIIGRINRTHVLDYVVPSVLLMNLSEPTIVDRVIMLINAMIVDRRLALPRELLLDKIQPAMASSEVVDNAEKSEAITKTLNYIMEVITCDRARAIEEERLGHPAIQAMVRRQTSIDEPAPPFVIPNLYRKMSSAEEMARKNSATQAGTSAGVTDNIKKISEWIFGSNTSNNTDSGGAGPSGAGAGALIGSGLSTNLLRVVNALPGRRLSDNTLMTPKIKIAPSSASTPGGTPAGSQAVLPARRHSSIGPQERRPSQAHLTPVVHGRGHSAGSGLSVPTTSHHAGGSLPGSTTYQLNQSRKGSAASVKSAQAAARQSPTATPMATPTRVRRQSICPPSPSSGAAVAQAGTLQTNSHGVRRLLPTLTSTSRAHSPRTQASRPHRMRTTSLNEQVGRVANRITDNISNMAESLSNAVPNASVITRSIPTNINPLRGFP